MDVLSKSSDEGFDLQAGINMARASALWNVAGDIYELTLFSAFRADIRWSRSGNKISALGAFPVG